MTGETTTITGGIDDATHKITGLYMTKHECRFGYSEVEQQELERYGASAAVYIDRHAALVKNARRHNKTLEERLQYSKYEATHWTELCAACKTEIILALSPASKRTYRTPMANTARSPAVSVSLSRHYHDSGG